MGYIASILKLVAILVAAVLIGNWFLDEVRKARRDRKPWYAAYLSVPGLLLAVFIFVVPILLWLLENAGG